MPQQSIPSAHPVKGIELTFQSKRYKYFIPKESGHNYVYIDPIEGVKMDSPQAKLRLLGDTELQLRNCHGNYETFVKKQNSKEFDRVSNYTKIHDRDRIVFGPPSNSSVEFTVKVLYDSPKETTSQLKAPKAINKNPSDSSTKSKDSPIQIKKMQSDNNNNAQADRPSLRRTRSADKALLKPPSGDKKAYRKSDGYLHQAVKERKEGDRKINGSNLNLPQILDNVKECSSSTQLGDGYNALSYSFTGHCALADRTPSRSPKDLPLEDFQSDVFVLDSTSSVLSVDEVGFGMGARLTSDVSLKAKYDDLVSMQRDISKVFVKYVRNGKYGWQSIKSVRYRRGIDTKDPKFWTEYGDYYVSDIQRWFGCCVVMVFHVEHLNDIDQAQTDIEARFRDILEVKSTMNTKLLEDRRWAMHRIFCNCYGYSQEILNQSTGLSSLTDVLKFLDKINSITPPGVARRVTLTRYLDTDPEITIPKNTYRELNDLHQLSGRVLEKSLTPGIHRNTGLQRLIDTVLSEFRANSVNYFDKRRQGDSKEFQQTRKDIRKRLEDTRIKADLAINRDGLIFEAQRLYARGPQLDTPRGKRKAKIWRWRCGMTGIFKEKSKIASETTPEIMYTISKGDFTPQCPNYESRSQDVNMAQWNFTVPKRNILRSLWSATTNIAFRQEIAQTRAHYIFDRNMFQLLLGDDQPIYVVGWTVKCEYVDERGEPSKGNEGQSLSVRLESQMVSQNEALSNYLDVMVKSTDRIRCSVQVFFVYQRVFRGLF